MQYHVQKTTLWGYSLTYSFFHVRFALLSL